MLLSASLFLQSGGEEVAHDFLVVIAGGHHVVIGVDVVAGGFDITEECLKCCGVFLGDEIWFGDDGGAVLHIDEAVGAVEIEVDLLFVHEMEHGDVVFPEAEVLEGVGELGGIGKEIGNNDHEGALPDFLRHGVEGADESGFSLGFDLGEGIEHEL